MGTPEDSMIEDPVISPDYTELVLDLIAQIPPGRATSYGAIAAGARLLTGRGSARTVAAVLSRHGDQVPWWRVVSASGAIAEHLRSRALPRLRAEGTPLTEHNPPRVDLRNAGWGPELLGGA